MSIIIFFAVSFPVRVLVAAFRGIQLNLGDPSMCPAVPRDALPTAPPWSARPGGILRRRPNRLCSLLSIRSRSSILSYLQTDELQTSAISALRFSASTWKTIVLKLRHRSCSPVFQLLIGEIPGHLVPYMQGRLSL